MTQDSSIRFNTWLHRARLGDSDCLADLLDMYRNYLRVLARMQLGSTLQARASPSDLAQESILAARKAFVGFRGKTEPEMLAWLRKVLATQLINASRFHSAKQRDVHREQRIEDAMEQSSREMRSFLVADAKSPSQVASQREQEVILANALARLPRNYSDVIVLSHFESRSFPEIASRTDCTIASVKSTWTRAMTRLRDELGDQI